MLKDRKKTVVTVRLTEEDRRLLKEKSEEAGLTLSAYVRGCALQHAQIRPFVDEADQYVLAQISNDMLKIGVNLNQIARALNSGRHPDASEINIGLKMVEDITIALRIQLKRMIERAARINIKGWT